MGPQRSEAEHTPETPGCLELYTTTDAVPADNGGWHIGDTYQVTMRDAHEDYDYVDPQSYACNGQDYYNLRDYRYFKPILRMPDGSEHEMRIEGSFPQYSTSGLRDYLKQYYKFPSGGDTSAPHFSSPVRMSTIDGSFYTVVYNPDSYSTKWTIYAPDGTRIEQDSDGQRIVDTNGNSLLFSGDSTNGTYAKDEATGRMIRWAAATYDSTDAIRVQYQSTGGSWQSVYVVFGTTTVTGQLYSKEDWPTGDSPGQCNTDVTAQAELSVIRRIVFPNTESGVAAPEYDFDYNSDSSATVASTGYLAYCGQYPLTTYTRTASYGWGELSSVTTPAGAEIAYTYAHDGNHDLRLASAGDTNEVAKDFVTAKAITHDGTTDTWTYALSELLGEVTGGSVTNPDGSSHSESYHPSNAAYLLSASTGAAGHMYRTIDSGNTMTEKVWTDLAGTFAQFAGGATIWGNSVVDTEYTTLLDTDGTTRLKMLAKKFSYDYNGNVTQEIDYDWFDPSSVSFGSNGLPTGVPSGATVLRVTNTDYYNQAANSSSSNNYRTRSVGSSTVILGKPKETTVGTTSTVKSDTKFSYDGNSYGTAPTIGNLTTTSVYSDTTSSWISTSSTYTTNGNVASTTDANGNVTAITYGSVGGYSDLYPTQVVQAYGTGVARTMQTAYDFYTGLPTSVTDYDNSVTTTTAYDIRLRPTLVKNAYGTSLENWLQTDYHDHDRFVVTKADLVSANDGKKVATQFFDQLGRVRLAKTLEDASTQSATNETDGIKVETKYAYASGYTYQLTSNPFRASTSSGASGEETMGWTRSKAWATGRESQVETFSGSSMPAPWGSNTSSTGVVDTVIAANATTVTDQASKVRRSITDGGGRLIRVDEPTTSGLGTVSAPNQYTSYTYDVLNNLTGVSQGSQTRTFTYNSLGRLTSAANPESGTISYGYDSNGNLTSKTDARSITTSYTYDALNRVTARDYSDPTPDVTYTYDNKTHGYGKLSKVASSVSTTEYTAFDILGRVTGHKQTTASTDYTTSYTYFLGGQVETETYPSGRIVINNFNSDGSLSAVYTTPNELIEGEQRAGSFVYNPAGAVQSLQLGNGKYETTHFNPRLQPIQIGLGTSTSDTSLLKLEYGYGTTTNNGNVVSQEITVSGLTPHFIQAYTYDELNRLASATETYNGSQNWKQEFSYDRYGNRNFVTGSGHTTMPSTFDATNNPTFSSTTNRITSSGYSFDNSGNMTGDPAGRTFVYDAENKQKSVSASSTVVGRYSYDGDGRRVAKASTSDNTIFVYDASGRLIEEYAGPNLDDVSATGEEGQPVPPTTSYVYAGSRLLSTETSSGTSYLTADHLGSPRINTDGSGSVTARHDYMPFGEEIATSQRTTGVGYAGDSVRKKFTGYERDTETGLDFAQDRMYNTAQGRFAGPDPVSPDRYTPATHNRYQYCLNNPLRFVDVTGGYDEEVHRDLTAALAVLVGFSEEQGNAIGNADQQVDIDHDPEGTGEQGLNDRIQFHFTTRETRNGLWATFESRVNNGDGGAYAALGTFLHAEQDSFSHAPFGPVLGQVPGGFNNLFKNLKDLPNILRKMEEEARKYDVTTKYPNTAVAMARDTIAVLLQARNLMAASGRFGSFRRPVPIDDPFVNRKLIDWANTDGRDAKRKILYEIMNYAMSYGQNEGVGSAPRKKRTKTKVRVLDE